MSTYSIKELGLISGVKPHTIRIWEQRYGLLEPMRSDTNIRSYDDEQLKKLLNVKELMNAGMKISQISELSQKQISAELTKFMANISNDEFQFENIINNIIVSIATFDQFLFEKTFSDSIRSFGLAKTYLHVIYPTLIKIGLMWSNSNIMPAQEHFFSNLIKQKLFSAIDALPIAEKSDQTWVLFLNEQEEHEIGLLFAYYLLRQHNKKVIYLGSKVPYDNLKGVVNHCKATHIYTFLVKNHSDKDINDLVNKMNADFRKAMVCLSGKKEIIEKIPLVRKRIWVKDIQTLIKLIQ